MTIGANHAHVAGFDLHAGVVVPAGERARLERLCRYALRPPIAQARMRLDTDGQVWITLRHQWADGTTHLRFEPFELLERLAVLVPRPRINLVLYYGVLAPRAPWRSAVVASAGSEWSHVPAGASDRTGGSPRGRGAYLWAELMRRTFGIDVLDCPRCGGRLRLLALIEHASIVTRILRHLGLPADVPALAPARPPPLPLDPAGQTDAPDATC